MLQQEEINNEDVITRNRYTISKMFTSYTTINIKIHTINTFAASYLNTQGLNNS